MSPPLRPACRPATPPSRRRISRLSAPRRNPARCRTRRRTRATAPAAGPPSAAATCTNCGRSASARQRARDHGNSVEQFRGVGRVDLVPSVARLVIIPVQPRRRRTATGTCFVMKRRWSLEPTSTPPEVSIFEVILGQRPFQARVRKRGAGARNRRRTPSCRAVRPIMSRLIMATAFSSGSAGWST